MRAQTRSTDSREDTDIPHVNNNRSKWTKAQTHTHTHNHVYMLPFIPGMKLLEQTLRTGKKII